LIEVHDEADGVAAGTAAEAIIELTLGLHAKRRRFFLMEGAAGRIVLAGLFERDSLVHNLYDICSAEQVIDESLWN